MTNKEKLQQLKDYELAEIIAMLNLHVDEIQHASSARYELDAFDLNEDAIGIIISWLNSPYDEEKGFEFYCSYEKTKRVYLKSENLETFDYLHGTVDSIDSLTNEV